MLSIINDNEGNTTISFDTHFRVESDWLNVGSGIFTFADVLTVNLSAAELVVCTRHKFDSAHIGFHGVEPVERATITGGTLQQKFDSLLAALVARGDFIDGTS